MSCRLAVLVLFLAAAPDARAQALLPSRFESTTHLGATLQANPIPAPHICDKSKGLYVAQGAAGTALAIGAIAFAVVLMEITKIWEARQLRFPLYEVMAAGAVVGAIVSAVQWERRCG